MVITGLNKGGAEKNYYYLCKSINNDSVANEAISISLHAGWYFERLKEDGIFCIAILYDRNILNIIKRVVKIFIVMFSKKIQLVHSFMPIGGIIGVFVKITKKIPLVYSVRCTPSATLTFFQKPALTLFHKISLIFSDIITCNSPFAKLDLKKQTRKNIDVIYNGIDIAEIEEKKKVKSKGNSFINALTIANMRDYGKDINTLLKVASILPYIRFEIIGDGPKKNEYLKIAKNKNIKNVLFLGYKNSVYEYLCKSDIFIHLTKFEGFPNTIIEAFACKVPVVASDIPAISMLVRDNVECLLVPNGKEEKIAEAISQLIRNEDLKEKLTSNALSRVKQDFMIGNKNKENIAIYRALTIEY